MLRFDIVDLYSSITENILDDMRYESLTAPVVATATKLAATVTADAITKAKTVATSLEATAAATTTVVVTILNILTTKSVLINSHITLHLMQVKFNKHSTF